MGIVSTLMTAAVLAGVPVEVSTFSGSEHKAELTALAKGELTFSEEGKEQKLALSDVLELRLPAKSETVDPAASEVLFTDGSVLHCRKVTSTEKTFSLEHATLGKLEIPADFVASIRLAPPANAVAEAWSELTSRRENSDILVIRKGELLDHLKGVVGPITDDNVQFLLGGNSVNVARAAKLYGVVYGNRKLPKELPICRAVLGNQDSVELKSLSWNGEAFQGELISGAKITLPADKFGNPRFQPGQSQISLRHQAPQEQHRTAVLLCERADFRHRQGLLQRQDQ